MAKLITTQAEKDAASYLDWNDAALSKFCKKMALMMQAQRRKIRDDSDGLKAVLAAFDGLLLLAKMVECNAGKLDLKFGDYTHAGRPEGAWRIRVEKIAKAATRNRARETGE